MTDDYEGCANCCADTDHLPGCVKYDPKRPSDAALLEFAFRSSVQQRVLLHADFGKRSAPEIRAALMREAGLTESWAAWAERVRQKPVELIGAPARPDRMPPEPIPETPRTFWPPYVPRRFERCTLDTFRTDFSGPEYEEQLRTALTVVDAWVRAAQAGKPACVALVGSQGNGKSHLLWAAVDRLSKVRVRCYARSWYRLADELRYGGGLPWMPKPVKEPYELRQALQDSPAVAIDEACATAGTQFDESELGKIVKNGWDNRQALILTTNVHPLSNLMGDAAADRFTIIQLTAPSGRNRE